MIETFILLFTSLKKIFCSFLKLHRSRKFSLPNIILFVIRFYIEGIEIFIISFYAEVIFKYMVKFFLPTVFLLIFMCNFCSGAWVENFYTPSIMKIDIKRTQLHKVNFPNRFILKTTTQK